MKKIYKLFLLGQLIIFSYIFSNSIYDIYGLMNIGDTGLKSYVIEKPAPDILNKVYDELSKDNAKIQIVKMPISEDEDYEVTIYQVFHTNIDEVRKFKSISKNQYEYYQLTKEEFIDGTGLFYTDLAKTKVREIGEKVGVAIADADDAGLVSFESVLKNNALDFFILLVTTMVVILIYVISTAKKNAVKTLLGFSPVKILKDRILELVVIEGTAIVIITAVHACYLGVIGKLSLFYVLFLVLFLCFISAINLILMLLTQRRVKKMDVVSSVKNRMFTPVINNVVQVVKLVLIFMITITISMCIKSYNDLTSMNERIEQYKILNDFYSSYGFNSDEYDKLERNKSSYVEVGNAVKNMYIEYMDDAYLMDDEICRKYDEHFLQAFGKTKEQMIESINTNYIIVNENYLKNYIYQDEELPSMDSSKQTLLVPEKYKNQESEIVEFYSQMLKEMSYSEFYGEQPVEPAPLQIIYVEGDRHFKMLSSLQNEEYYDVEIFNPIIVVDSGKFSGTYYMYTLSECQLAFKLNDRGEFNVMLSKYGLNKLFHAYTMLIPFMQEISNYEFLIEQSMVFIGLFFVTLLFVIYVSNYIEMQVNNKKYGIMYQLGYSTRKVLDKNIFVTVIMLVVSIPLLILNINIIAYLSFVVFDFIVLICLYKKLIVKELYKVLNGGN